MQVQSRNFNFADLKWLYPKLPEGSVDGLGAAETEMQPALVLRAEPGAAGHLLQLSLPIPEQLDLRPDGAPVRARSGPALAGAAVWTTGALEREGKLDRALEFLPSDEELSERMAAGQGLTRPELAVLVVRQSDGIPGQGWFVSGGARDHGYEGPWEGPEAARFIRALQSQTFAFWQSGDQAGGEVSR